MIGLKYYLILFFEKYLLKSVVLMSFFFFNFYRDLDWKYLQSVQNGTHGNFPRLSYPTFFPRFESQDIIPPDDFLNSDEELDCVLFGILRGQVVGLRYYTGVVSMKRY